MKTPISTTLFLLADETTNAGERDYMLAMAAQIEKTGRPEGTKFLFYKIGGKRPENPADPTTLPLTNADYTRVPMLADFDVTALFMEHEVHVIGVGHSTYYDLMNLKENYDDALEPYTGVSIEVGDETHNFETLASAFPELSLSYITHKIDDARQLDEIVFDGIHLFTTVAAEELAKINAADAARVKVTHLDAVPHNQRGIAVLKTLPKKGGLDIHRHPEEAQTPIKTRDAAQEIVRRLGLSAAPH